ncbi:NAD(P)H-dependent oxidoreductase [Amycolatopsis minnesotensis]|uniref:NAD(P)H-dependent oxidoreductase n=1 Tax=Amycolatopsis minnesotensis TaxID=337894 RepID=A0ABN2QBY4_9PSEU
MTALPRIAVIIGSVREGRIGDGVGRWVAGRLAGEPLEPMLIDLDGHTFPSTMTHHPDVEGFAETIGSADGVIVVTPEYNHSFPGPLKTAIDAVGPQWRAKPVGFVSYGGMAGGLRAVEALRPVFAELHTVTIRETVSLHNPWGPLADDSTEYPDFAAEKALHVLTTQLLWWAEALREARAKTPYPA